MLARRNPHKARLKICRFCSSADLHTANDKGDKDSRNGGLQLQAIISNGAAAASYLSSFVYRPSPADPDAKEKLSKRFDEKAEFVAHIKDTLSRTGVGPVSHDDLEVRAQPDSCCLLTKNMFVFE